MDIYMDVSSGNRIAKNEHREYGSILHERDAPNYVMVRGSFMASGLSENNGPRPDIAFGLRIDYSVTKSERRKHFFDPFELLIR